MSSRSTPSLLRLVLADYGSLLCALFPIVTWSMFAATLLGLWREQPEDRAVKYWVLLCSAVGSTVVCLPPLVRRVRSVRSLFRDGAAVWARLSGVWMASDRGRIEYEYTFGGQAYRGSMALSRSKRTAMLEQGQAIVVLVDPTDPATSIVPAVFGIEVAEAAGDAPVEPIDRDDLLSGARDQPAAGARRSWGTWLVVAVIGFAWLMLTLLRSSSLSGVVVTALGETLIYRSSKWMLALLAIPPLLMFLLGAAIASMRHVTARLVGGAVVLASLGTAVALIPLVFVGGLVVTPDGFRHTAGFWWAPATREVRFDSLESLSIVPEPARDGRPAFVLVCHRRDGQAVRIASSDALRAGLRSIILRARQRGVTLDLE